MKEGDPVYAAGSGVVVYAGDLAGRGVVSIEHNDGLRTTYEPVAPSVTRGERVQIGQPIATIEGTHCGLGGTCLHWGAKRGATHYINPLWLLEAPHVRLYR